MNGREPGDPEDEPVPEPAELDLSVLEIPILTEVLEIPILTEVLEIPVLTEVLEPPSTRSTSQALDTEPGQP